jgi:hypothetical protein
MSAEIDKNVCEICGQKAVAGILDNYNGNNDSNNQTRIRYSCHDHYLQVYKKIQEERKNSHLLCL